MSHEGELPDKSYFMINDEEEQKRLNYQHAGIVLGLGGLYPAPSLVQTVLAKEEGKNKRVLDLGCGSGIWSKTMAQEFPHAEVLGLDINPPSPNPNTIPQNCHFQKYDVNVGLSNWENQFDLVHARLIGSGIKDFHKTLKEMIRTLKPGGMLVFLDADYFPVRRVEDGFAYYPPAMKDNDQGSYFAKILIELHRSVLLAGGDLHTVAEILNGGIWDQELLDPKTCGAANLYVPCTTGGIKDPDPKQEQLLREIGQFMKDDFMTAHRKLHPHLIRAGLSEEMLRQWAPKIDEEFKTGSHPFWVRFPVVWGCRRDEQHGTRLPLTWSAESAQPYRYLRPFYTREEGFAVQEKLDSSKSFTVNVTVTQATA